MDEYVGRAIERLGNAHRFYRDHADDCHCQCERGERVCACLRPHLDVVDEEDRVHLERDIVRVCTEDDDREEKDTACRGMKASLRQPGENPCEQNGATHPWLPSG